MMLVVKNLPVVQETQVQSVGQEDPLEEGMATHSSILAWRIHGQGSQVGYAVHKVEKSWTWRELTQLKNLSTEQHTWWG